MVQRIQKCALLLIMLVFANRLSSQGVSFRLSYDNPIVLKPGTYYKSFPGFDFEFNRNEDVTSQLFVGLGFTYFKVRPGSYTLNDPDFPEDSITYSNMPVIAFRAGLRGSILREAEHSPTVGLSLGYFFVRYKESIWQPNVPEPTTVALRGGMLAVTPEIGYIFAQQKQVSYALQARMHITGSLAPERFWMVMDLGAQVTYSFW
jgi:hypothetical protein